MHMIRDLDLLMVCLGVMCIICVYVDWVIDGEWMSCGVLLAYLHVIVVVVYVHAVEMNFPTGQ